MASSTENVSMALFCDFENVALGVRDANYEKFDIKPVLERLLLKGSIVVKKAYCDWDRYKAFKAPMHEANFELIEIPHVRQSGKNSADIRMVVDALDLCYTKSHVNTFVIISGDSDFSPLVSKLRENNKKVIGVGVKQSTSDLLVANCDEFIFYDDLVRESRRVAAKRDPREGQAAVKRSPEEEKRRRDDMDKRRSEAVEMAVDTFDALVSERGDSGKIWASVLKEAIKRRKPDFSESYYGFRTFGNLLEEAKARGLLEFGRDEKSGAYVFRSSGATGGGSNVGEQGGPEAAASAVSEAPEGGRQDGRGRRSRGGRKQGERKGPQHAGSDAVTEEVSEELQLARAENAFAEAEAAHAAEDAGTEQYAAAQSVSTYANAEAAADAAEAAEDAAIDAAVNGNVQGRGANSRNSAAKKPARSVKAAQAKAAVRAVPAPAPAPAAAAVPAAAPSPWQQFAPVKEHAPEPAAVADALAEETADVVAVEEKAARAPAKSRTRAPAKGRAKAGVSRISEVAAEAAAATEAPVDPEPAPAVEPSAGDTTAAAKPASRGPRRPRKPAAKQGA